MFLSVARLSAEDFSEEWQRTAAGRAYYSVFLETRSLLRRWAILGMPTHQAHAFVRRRLEYSNVAELKQIARILNDLYELRTRADYEMDHTFASPFEVQTAIELAQDAMDQLDAIDSDPARRAAAIAAIRAIP